MKIKELIKENNDMLRYKKILNNKLEDTKNNFDKMEIERDLLKIENWFDTDFLSEKEVSEKIKENNKNIEKVLDEYLKNISNVSKLFELVKLIKGD